MLNNPGLMQAAQGLMANGGLERLMSNPMVANMVSQQRAGIGGFEDASGHQC
jgi:small glutamine-rich tetratricopeptide repeat-containing protein alpha